ncbi:MAG: HD domain-containing protein [Gemmatimonadetes bacterium]|nr:HD domain-containing protein [Gemmatimonadota bacterium]
MTTPPDGTGGARAELSMLQLLLEVGRQFNQSLDFRATLATVMDRVVSALSAERAALFLVDEDGEPQLAAARGMDQTAIEAQDFRISRGLVREVIQTRKGVVSSNAMQDARFAGFGSVAINALRSIMCAPILYRGDVRGLVYVDNRLQAGIFGEASLALLSAIAEQAAGAIENARFDTMKREIIVVLANAIEAKDLYTRGHVERVTGYSVAIGRALGLPAAEMRDLETAAVLHDVGKIGVPDAILQKPGRLDPEERAVMERHSALGEHLITPIDLPRRVKKAVRQHHERWDGKGYPDGAAGEEANLFARIIAVADTFDAMTSDRPYRKGLPREVATEEVRKGAGAQFDPAVAEAFLRVLAEGHLPGEGGEGTASSGSANAT